MQPSDVVCVLDTLCTPSAPLHDNTIHERHLVWHRSWCPSMVRQRPSDQCAALSCGSHRWRKGVVDARHVACLHARPVADAAVVCLHATLYCCAVTAAPLFNILLTLHSCAATHTGVRGRAPGVVHECVCFWGSHVCRDRGNSRIRVAVGAIERSPGHGHGCLQGLTHTCSNTFGIPSIRPNTRPHTSF